MLKKMTNFCNSTQTSACSMLFTSDTDQQQRHQCHLHLSNLEEQCIYVKFCFKLSKNCTDISNGSASILRGGGDCMSRMKYYKWLTRFKAGKPSTNERMTFHHQQMLITSKQYVL